MNTILDFRPEAVVVDAGSFPHNEIPLRWLDESDHIVCCDGAANAYLATGRKVWRIVGDCDSLSPEIMEKYGDIVRRFPDQETNDQTKAVRYLKEKGITKIAIVAATGLREDHTLGNLSLLIDYHKQGIEARAYTDYGVFIPVWGNIELRCEVASQISIFNFGATDLHADGLRYPIRDFKSWWEGTLNETTSPIVSIRAKGHYLIFITYPN